MKWITISSQKVNVCGKLLDTDLSGSAMLTEIYRKHINDYTKYFKMDGLCKLGFVASELLLQQENTVRFIHRDDRAVILFNQHGSIDTDKKFQTTICNATNYFPSPAMFVYTLPNIITGEIAIHNKYFGETSFYVLNHFSTDTIVKICMSAFKDDATKSILGGWLDYADDQHFYSIMFLYDQKEKEDPQTIIERLNKINKDTIKDTWKI